MRRLLIAATVILISLLWTSASAQVFNLGAAPANAQALDILGFPAPGQLFVIRISAPPGASVALLVGTTAATDELLPGLTLEIDPSSIVGVVPLFADASGFATVSITWPSGVAPGTFAVFQGFIITPSFVQFTNASTIIAQDTFVGPPLPAPTVTSPASPTTATTVNLSGTAPSSGQTVLIQNGSSTTTVIADQGPAMNAFSATVDLNQNSLNRFFVYAFDGMGNQSAPTVIDVVQDEQPPTVSISFPPAGAILNTATTTVTGTVADVLSGSTGLEVVVNGQQAQVDIGIGTNGTFQVTGVPLAAGTPTLLQATATDAAGNVRTTEITVQFDPGGGDTLTVISGDSQTGDVGTTLADPVVVQLTDSQGTPVPNRLITLHVTQSDGRLGASPSAAAAPTAGMLHQTTTDANGMVSVFWRLGSDAGMGNNRLAVTATGVAATAFVCASATVNPANTIAVSDGDEQTGETGTSLCEPLRVWVSDGRNAIADVPVTFTVVAGGGVFPSGGSSVTVLTDATGHAQADYVLGVIQGDNWIQADFPGNTGSPAFFHANALDRDPALGTRLSGVVLSNGQEPIGSATCRLVLPGNPPSNITVTSDIDGRFEFTNIPASGAVDLFVEGLGATQLGGQTIPAGTFPNLHFQVVLIPGAANQMPRPVLLPALDPANAVLYDGTQDVELTIDGVAGMKMLIKAGSMTNPDGTIPSVANPVLVSVNQVHTDDIPMPIGNGVAPLLAWTLQPSGAHFDPPVAITYPNMAGLPPGAVVDFLAFNHDTGKFEIVAPGHVVEDGSVCVTDPGHGSSVAGWHASSPPLPPTTSAGDCSGQPNGCGPEGGIKVPDSVPGVFDFTTACNNHDLCYGNSQGPSRATCDANFYFDMISSCNIASPGLCSQVAFTYYLAVAAFGQGAFDAARQAAAAASSAAGAAAAPAGGPPSGAPCVGGGGSAPPPQPPPPPPPGPPLITPPPGFVDADNDILNDSWETAHGLDPTDPTDAFQDDDGDGLPNFFEFTMQTDPQVVDTDGDGQDDYSEYLDATFSTGLDQEFIASVAGRSARVSIIGSYQISNIPVNGELHRIYFVGTDNGRPVYGRSGFFSGVLFGLTVVGPIEKSTTPFAVPESLTVSVTPAVLTSIGQTAVVSTTAAMSDGTTEMRDGPIEGTTYSSSNPAIATVDANGVVTAQGPGTAFITVRNEGVTSVAFVFVDSGATTTLQCSVVDATMVPVAGATVDFGTFLLTSDSQGQISATVPASSESLVGQVQTTIGGMNVFGQSTAVAVIPGGITDLGIIVVDVDTDGDGLPDWYETAQFGTNPNAIDSDGDGLADGLEAFILGTDPSSTDSDLDGLDDGVEVSLGTDPAAFDALTTVTGVVHDAGGNTVSGADVRILDAPQAMFEAVSDGAGGFAINGWPASLSPVRVAARAPGQVGISGPTAAIPTLVTNVGTVDLAPEEPYMFPSPRIGDVVNPQDVALGDLDGDGLLDAVVAGGAAGQLALRAGNGDGSLGPPVLVAMSGPPLSVRLGDLDGDGNLDVVTPGTATISIRLGLGNGMFGSLMTTDSGFFSERIRLVDVTGDGILDIIAEEVVTSVVHVLPGNGDGSFAPATILSPTGPVRAITAGDVDGDGDIDVLLPTNSNVFNMGQLQARVNIFLNDGSGTFTAAPDAFTTPNIDGARLVDLDEDGQLDLVTSSTLPTPSIGVVLGDGNGSFGPIATFPVAVSPREIEIADLDGDGHVDLIVGSSSSSVVSVLFGSGTGTLTPHVELSTGRGPEHPVVGDLDLDGALDVVAANLSSGDMSVVLAEAPGVFPVAETLAAGNSPRDSAVIDVNGDGRPDIVVVDNAGNSVFVVLADATGFLPAVGYAVGMMPSAVVARDMNGDGFPDLAVLNTGSDDVSIFTNDGLGGFTQTFTAAVGTNSISLTMGDVDADGVPDILAGSTNSSVGVTVLIGLGDGTFLSGPSLTGTEAGDLDLADLDGDGRRDLVVGAHLFTHIYLGNGNGTFTLQMSFLDGIGVGRRKVGVGDIDGDNDVDIFVSRSTNVLFIENLGGGGFSSGVNIPGGFLSAEDVLIQDVNADGFPDIVTAFDFGQRFAVQLGHGDGTFDAIQAFGTTGNNSGARSLDLADLDGDGDIDVVCSVPGGIFIARSLLVP